MPKEIQHGFKQSSELITKLSIINSVTNLMAQWPFDISDGIESIVEMGDGTKYKVTVKVTQ